MAMVRSNPAVMFENHAHCYNYWKWSEVSGARVVRIHPYIWLGLMIVLIWNPCGLAEDRLKYKFLLHARFWEDSVFDVPFGFSL